MTQRDEQVRPVVVRPGGATTGPAASSPASRAAATASTTGDEERLASRVDGITQALAAAGDGVDPALVEQSLADLATVQHRLALGVERTVVALVGGTGSGKSSLFNAISGLSFADVGAIRPTTDRAAACTWGGPATELLDFLAVAEHRRIQRESLLDAEDQRALHGLVLLDMPDHDSVAEAHSHQVDRLLPLVDILIWVVDPQKYADNALHERYLRELAGRQDAMLVLVNQVDTIPAGAVPRVRDSVRDLLRSDGLGDVEVFTTSAVTGEGVADVREVLARAVARRSTAARTAEVEVDAVARRLGSAVADQEPELGEPATQEARDGLSRAAGVPAVAESVRAAVSRVRPTALARPEPPAPSAVSAVRRRWLEAATHGLSPRWQRLVERESASEDTLRAAVTTAVGRVALPAARHAGAFALHVVGLVLAAAGVLALVVGLVDVLAGLDLPGGVLLGAGVGLAVLGGGAVLIARLWRGSQAERSATEYHRAVDAEVQEVVRRELTVPAGRVLDHHRRLRHALATGAPQDA